MKLKRLRVESYKNLQDASLTFGSDHLLTAVIGSNGSGKSNLIEAILSILIGIYFCKNPGFDFELEFATGGTNLHIRGERPRLVLEIDGVRASVEEFAKTLRDGVTPPTAFPELTFVYYSGECQRVRRLIRRYQRHFQVLTREPETDRHRPLFVESSNQQAQLILLALVAHASDAITEVLDVSAVEEASIVLRSPRGFDPDRHEPKLWNTEGAVRRIVAAIDETSARQESRRQEKMSEDGELSGDYTEVRTYRFRNGKGEGSIHSLASRLTKSGDNVYLALSHLDARGILRAINYRVVSKYGAGTFDFDELSEGQKQLIAVIGALGLTNQGNNLVLLDEPDTHLNPHWSWEYVSMLSDALGGEAGQHSTVLMATHDPIMISGLVREQVWLADATSAGTSPFRHPRQSPRGQGVANLLSSREFFGLPSSLDKETQKLMDERLELSVRPTLSPTEKERLRELNERLQMLRPGVSERDPEFVEYLRSKPNRERQ